ncbi:MAG: hypothetical protein OXC79_03790 [Candidatus Poribacteria bacterium]|nr:hypothetical protein [Candidatus Poribacteria bacterium]
MVDTFTNVGAIKELKEIKDILIAAIEEADGREPDSVELKALQKELKEIKGTLIEVLEEALECRFR